MTRTPNAASAAARLLAIALVSGAMAAPAPVLAAPSAPSNQPDAHAPVELAPDIVAAAAKPGPVPKLTSIPPTPKDVRTPAQWKADVVATRRAGANLVRTASNEPWSIGDTESWAAEERARAVPPPPITTTTAGDTEAFAAALRARATPPPRSRPAAEAKQQQP